ncbi:YlbF family regulator [Alicyclobacillus herbarius]|uniref:YlbF family regulator n=1 Tax=Alicyclobacillus herbarius TaxID=122960 RepID=UPI0003F781E9|nr:YlbF family regulator [Alicyclobacillus herbarius]
MSHTAEAARVTREAILTKADAIAKQITALDAYARYWQAREKMERHKRAQELFEELKLKTNQSLILKQRLPEDHPKVMLAELEMQEVESELWKIPVAMQYKEAQAELNECLQGVISVLLTRIRQAVPVEQGPRQGCGRGHGGQGCDCGRR